MDCVVQQDREGHSYYGWCPFVSLGLVKNCSISKEGGVTTPRGRTNIFSKKQGPSESHTVSSYFYYVLQLVLTKYKLFHAVCVQFGLLVHSIVKQKPPPPPPSRSKNSGKILVARVQRARHLHLNVLFKFLCSLVSVCIYVSYLPLHRGLWVRAARKAF